MPVVALVKGYDEEAVCGAGGVAGGIVGAEDGGGVGVHARGCSEAGVQELDEGERGAGGGEVWETEDCEREAGEVEGVGGVEVGEYGRGSVGRHGGQVYGEEGSGGKGVWERDGS